MVDDIISISPPYNGGEKGGNNVETNQNQGHQGGMPNNMNNIHLNQNQLQQAQQQQHLQQAQQHQQQMNIQSKGYNYQQQQQQPQPHLMNQLINSNNGFQQQIQ